MADVSEVTSSNTSEQNEANERSPTPKTNSATTTSEMNSIDMGEIIEETDTALMSTSNVLSYCKSKILNPYLKLLSLMGLRPASSNQTSKCIRILSNYHTFQMALLICTGYVLQYMACFRRDRGSFFRNSIPHNYKNGSDFYEKICYENSTFSYFIPSALHVVGYAYAIYLFRISDNEQLQNLMERVFLLSSFPPQRTPYTSPRKLLKVLWIYIILSLVWILTSLGVIVMMVTRKKIIFHWLDENPSQHAIVTCKIFLIICITTQDMVQATIITSYCLQAQLLTAHLHFLRNRLLTRTISPLDWMREIAEFKKLLKHLNEVLAPVICIFTVLNICWTVSGIAWIFNVDKVDSITNHNIIVHIINECLWLLASIVPFISAARLTTACSITQTTGHEIAVRPFLYQDASQNDLNAVLLFASSLQLSARLFRLPITGRCLCLFLTTASITLLVLGMCHYIE